MRMATRLIQGNDLIDELSAKTVYLPDESAQSQLAYPSWSATVSNDGELLYALFNRIVHFEAP